MHTSLDSNLSAGRVQGLKNVRSSEREIPPIERKLSDNKNPGRRSKKSLIDKINNAYDFKDESKRDLRQIFDKANNVQRSKRRSPRMNQYQAMLSPLKLNPKNRNGNFQHFSSQVNSQIETYSDLE